MYETMRERMFVPVAGMACRVLSVAVFAAFAAGLPGFGYASVAPSPDETWAEELDRSFGIDVARSITKARDYGMVNGHLSVNVWMDDVAELRRVHAPPYLCEDLELALKFNGNSVRTVSGRWRPECVRREGLTADGWRIGTEVRPVAGERSVILSVTARNTNAVPATMRIDHSFRGVPAYLARWRFSPPRAGLPTWTEGMQTYESGEKPAKIAYATSLFKSSAVEFRDVPPGGSRTCHFAFSLGAGDDVKDTLRRILADPEATVRRCDEAWRARVKALAEKVPRFETDDDGLKRLYTRSLIHFLLCEWNVKEFVVRPFYATGGMFGSCMCCYLWNLGGPYRMMPLVAPEATKEHLRTFMKLDLERCYAFNPCDGGPVGPYYPINQEKMIFMIHAYVMETGDVSFLHEKVAGRSVIERVVAMALAHDDLSKPAVLADYGPRNDHLELRKGLLYDGEMPDLNLRRIVLLRLADGLCRIAGHSPGVDLVARADALKGLCRERQWDAAQGWFTGKCSDGKRTTRWTIQMFKALGWGDWVLDADVSAALVKHLMDPDEFLGEYGVHSLAKMDPAYDEWDVDNGGPGACVSFAPAIAERLYADGRASEAATILNRLKWLGDRLPYWSDSHYADRPDYRHNTPLQLNIEGGVISQTIMFGMFGISVRDDFSIEIAPRLPDGTDHIALRGVRLAGRTFDVRCERGKGITVESDGKRHTASLDGRIVLPAVTGR